MWLVNILYSINSTVKCFGTHDFQNITVFLLDPNGPETFRGWPSDPPGLPPPIPLGIPGLDRGRYDTYGRCRRCSLRSDGKGFDH